MPSLTIVTALFTGLMAIFALWANPRRFSNQVFALIAVIHVSWLYCVYQAMLAGSMLARGQPADLEFWLRANAATIALLPWALWLLKGAIVVAEGERLRAVVQSLPWLALAGVLIGLAYAESFAFRHEPSSWQRGWAYLTYNAISLAAYGLCIVAIWRQIPRVTGIRRVELQFLGLTIGFATALVVALNTVGNVLVNRTWNRASIPLVFVCYAIVVVALSVHRIFDPKELFLLLAQRLIVLGALVAVALGSAALLPADFGPTGGVIVGLLFGGTCALWLDRVSRRWLSLDRGRRLDAMRREIIALARHVSPADKLVREFERLLCARCQATHAGLIFDAGRPDAAKRFEAFKTSGAHEALSELGAATPETLQRRKATPALRELRAFLLEQGLGALITAPRGSRTPSLLIALGPKTNEAPFTHPEIESLQNIAELMDNILTHSRMTAQAALQTRMEHLAMLSRGLAHDLKNLLTPVSSFLVHTDGSYAPQTAEAEVHAAARHSVHVMTEYVREALFFSERLEPRFEDVDVARLFQSVQNVTADRAAGRGITVMTDAGVRESITADGVLLQRMLANLVCNAIDASACGQTVWLRARNGVLGALRFEVVDRGSGIAPEHMGRIFEPYFTTKEFGDQVRGFGLGLTICQKIATPHGGRISVDSAPGRGTTVTFDLPAAAQRLVPAQPCLALP